jgi:uncharacterized protein YprB with RNaseH-like and TPR domain
LRRVLGDGALPAGAAPLERARGARPPDPAREAEREALRERLRQRLASLRVAAPRAPAASLVPAPPTPAVEDRRALEDQVGGEVLEGARGTYLRVERRYPLESVHGRVVLAEALAHPVRLRARDRGPDGARTLRLADAVFLDTETTGLAGGTGTVAFLIGTGQVEGDDFVVRQLALRDYPEEAAVLEALHAALGDRPLVTFNGRAFDWPLLLTRFSLQRLKVRERAHLDLLPQARRLWSGSLPSAALSMLERHVLGLVREEDLPGSEVPAAWFRWLRTGEGGLLARAFRHNETDVVSMLALLARIGAVLDGETASLIASPRDHLGTARLLLEHGDVERARRCLEAGLALAEGVDAGPLLHLKAHLARRSGDAEGALRAWKAALTLAPDRDVFAHVEAAKLLEHRLGRPEEALGMTTQALERAPAGTPAHADLLRRAERLRRRLAP